MSRLHSSPVELTVMSPNPEAVGFLPWSSGERGSHTYLKLQKQDSWALLDVGVSPALPVELQRTLMRLVNEGWSIQGEVHVSFEGRTEPGQDVFLETDAVKLEVGMRLLPLLDPQNGSPLLEKIQELRHEIAHEMGVVVPGVKVVDNLSLGENNYVVWVRETPVAEGEVFLDRLLVVGTLDQLSTLQGWSTTEPAFRMTAKWIEASEKERSQTAGCLTLGPLNVLVTHVKEVLQEHASELLGLQELHGLLERLSLTHPKVVEDFLGNTRSLRLLRRVLHNLLAERVSVRDLVTILEVTGDGLVDGAGVDEITEAVRVAVSRQICRTYSNEDGTLRALLLSDAFESRARDAMKNGRSSPARTAPDVDELARQVRRSHEDNEHPPVLFCDGSVRPLVRRLLERSMPYLAVLSTREIAPGVRIQIVGEVHPSGSQAATPADRGPEPKPPPAEKPKETLWPKKKSR